MTRSWYDTLRSIYSKSSFRGRPRVRRIENPNGSVMLAEIRKEVPRDIMNLGNRKTFSFNYNLNNVRTSYSQKRNATNEERYSSAPRDRLIKFIMQNYYYMYFGEDANEPDVREVFDEKLGHFHRAISRLTTRNESNTRMISAAQMYRLLDKLNKPTLVKLATLVES